MVVFIMLKYQKLFCGRSMESEVIQGCVLSAYLRCIQLEHNAGFYIQKCFPLNCFINAICLCDAVQLMLHLKGVNWKIYHILR
jgi:hypothetical protein